MKVNYIKPLGTKFSKTFTSRHAWGKYVKRSVEAAGIPYTENDRGIIRIKTPMFDVHVASWDLIERGDLRGLL